MNSKQLKYTEYLKTFPDCPKSGFEEIQGIFYRWVQQHSNGENDFLPLNRIKTPPQRILDQTDLMCIGYGLSLYQTNINALKNYRGHYEKSKTSKAKENFKLDKGSAIAAVKIEKEDGIADKPNPLTGHFTFHEYSDADLKNNIQSIFNIFDSDGSFKMEPGKGD